MHTGRDVDLKYADCHADHAVSGDDPTMSSALVSC